MFPSYQEYYKDFLGRIKDLPESVQTSLISLLKIRCEEGILPKESYDDDAEEYYDYEYNIPENLVGFIPLFDEYFYPEQLINPLIEAYAMIAIGEYRASFDAIKSTDKAILKSNPASFILSIKKISDNIFNKSHDVIKLIMYSKRSQFDKLLREYYDNSIEQSDLDKLFEEKKDFTSIEHFNSIYHNFISKNFMVYGLTLNKQLGEYKKLIENCKISNSESEKKISDTELIAEKYSNIYKAFNILNWMVLANEYKFYNKFQCMKNEIEKEIFKFISDNEKLFEEETIHECEDGTYTEKKNSIEAFCKSVEDFAESISEKINLKIKQDIQNLISNDINERNQLINTKTNQYIDEEINQLAITITDEDLLKGIKDSVALNMSINQLGYCFDKIEDTLKILLL